MNDKQSRFWASPGLKPFLVSRLVSYLLIMGMPVGLTIWNAKRAVAWHAGNWHLLAGIILVFGFLPFVLCTWVEACAFNRATRQVLGDDRIVPGSLNRPSAAVGVVSTMTCVATMGVTAIALRATGAAILLLFGLFANAYWTYILSGWTMKTARRRGWIVCRSDLPCERCGYDLRGSPPGGDCPECGAKQEAAHHGA